jgi:hypothetical protein
MQASILWPLGIGVWLGSIVFMAGAALFRRHVILALPLAYGLRRGWRRYHEEAARRLEDSKLSRTRSE